MLTMSSLTTIATGLACTIAGSATAISPEQSGLGGLLRNHARDLPIKRATDCGTWTMYCGGLPPADGSTERGSAAEEACNNACFYINFINRDYTATYESSTDNAHSRVQSGCQTQQGSVCNNMPFSQRFHDVFEQEVDTNAQQYNCDEFPMAGMAQDDFVPGGNPRNSLRCIDASHNSAGGAQFKNFEDGVGTGLKGRACDGPLPDGATFKIAFNYDDADTSKLGFCLDAPDPGQADIWNQFWLTQLAGGASGRIDYPYNPDTSNHYAVATTQKDVFQCRVEITRTAGDSYSGTVYDNYGKAQGYAAQQLPKDQDTMTIPGQGGLLDLAVVRLGEFGDSGTRGSANLFYYGIGEALGTVFPFNSLSTGCDADYANDHADAPLEGAYCNVPLIVDGENGPSQTYECLFPCNAA